MKQTHWVRAGVPSLEAALELFDAQVGRTGHVDNWWSWELARLPDGTVKRREPGPIPSWASSPESWRRAAWAQVGAQLRLQGPPVVSSGPIQPDEPECLKALDDPRNWLAELPQLIRRAMTYRAPPGVPSIIVEAIWESATAGKRLLDGLDEEQRRTLPWLAEQAPDAWPAHFLGTTELAPIDFAVSMHH
ncbi:MAG: hypothetical protein GQE15_00760 [Archangiaceae bacterium]|nr:hypothetical protein [Archangiaceae bacterium]